MRFQDICRRYGFYGIIIKILIRILDYIGIYLEVNYCFYKKLDEENIVSEKVGRSQTFRELIYQDFVKNNKCHWFSANKLDTIKEYCKMNDKNKYFGMVYNDELVCYGAISVENFEGCKIIMKLHETAGYLWDAYTNPNFRGRGYHRDLIKYRLHQLITKGKTEAYSFVAIYNKVSAKGFLKEGFIKQ